MFLAETTATVFLGILSHNFEVGSELVEELVEQKFLINL